MAEQETTETRGRQAVQQTREGKQHRRTATAGSRPSWQQQAPGHRTGSEGADSGGQETTAGGGQPQGWWAPEISTRGRAGQAEKDGAREGLQGSQWQHEEAPANGSDKGRGQDEEDRDRRSGNRR